MRVSLLVAVCALALVAKTAAALAAEPARDARDPQRNPGTGPLAPSVSFFNSIDQKRKLADELWKKRVAEEEEQLEEEYRNYDATPRLRSPEVPMLSAAQFVEVDASARSESSPTPLPGSGASQEHGGEAGAGDDGKVEFGGDSQGASRPGWHVVVKHKAAPTVELPEDECDDSKITPCGAHQHCPMPDAVCCLMAPGYCCPRDHVCRVSLGSLKPASCVHRSKICLDESCRKIATNTQPTHLGAEDMAELRKEAEEEWDAEHPVHKVKKTRKRRCSSQTL